MKGTPTAFGLLVRERRQKAGLEISELAAALGVTRQQVSAVENGADKHRNLARRHWPTLAQLLPVTEAELADAAWRSNPQRIDLTNFPEKGARLIKRLILMGGRGEVSEKLAGELLAVLERNA